MSDPLSVSEPLIDDRGRPSAAGGRDAVRISVVIPTYERRDILVRTLTYLARCRRPWPVEVVVVIDGSQDGSQDAVAALDLPFTITTIQQANSGSAGARNRGAAVARGEILLFLDDDMIVDEGILIEHEACHAAGADGVVGDIPLHPDSASSLLSDGVDRWSRLRSRRLRTTGGQITLADMLTGQFSVRRDLFETLGGFDVEFNRDGHFGGEDTDFGYRLIDTGADLRYSPRAISYQLYRVTATKYLRQWRDAGASDVRLSRKHALLGPQLLRMHGGDTRRKLAGAFAFGIRRVRPRLTRLVAARVDAGHRDRLTRMTFTGLRDIGYWEGASEAGGIHVVSSPVRVLAYHRIAEDQATQQVVTPDRLVSHLRALHEGGYDFVSLERYLQHVAGIPVGRPSILLTFDDGYRDLVEVVLPLLRDLGLTATVFVVTGQIGGSNVWDLGNAPTVRLLSAADLRMLTTAGWGVAVHSRNHRHLIGMSTAEIRADLAGALSDLAAVEVPAHAVLAYPYGEHTFRVRRASARAGYRASFALDLSGVGPYSRHDLPRVEVDRDTTASDLLARIAAPPRRRREQAVREARGLIRWVLLITRSGSPRAL